MKLATTAGLTALLAGPCNPTPTTPPSPTAYPSDNAGLAVCGTGGHAVTVNAVGLDASSDTVTVDVTYNGGCKAHEMTLCWNGWSSIAKPTELYGFFVYHWNNDDTCTTRVTERLLFDVSEIREDYSVFNEEGFGEDELVWLVWGDGRKFLYDFKDE